jgi:hypothetical protein
LEEKKSLKNVFGQLQEIQIDLYISSISTLVRGSSITGVDPMGKFDNQDEEVEEFEGEDEQEAEEDGDNEVEAAETSSESAGPAVNHEEVPEERTVASRQKLRDEMSEEIEAFLARGGKISQIEPNVTADPPRKPDSDYGSRPI